MFLKSLKITCGDGRVVRDIRFHDGLNLIVDETPPGSGKETGNNVGKTTVLKLIDFCLGGAAKGIYTDPETGRNEYKLVKDFLLKEKVLASLTLTDDLSREASREVLIERNFLSRKEKIQRIDGIDKSDDEFEEGQTDLLFPGHYGKKPTFRQIIAHNIRYSDASVNNTLKHLHRFTRDDEYETLFLFLFGCEFEQGDEKQRLRTKINIEVKFKERLESEQTKSAYETALALIESDIEELERRKESLDLDPDFESDLERLNEVKYRLNLVSSEIGKLELRRNLVQEARDRMRADVSDIDQKQLEQIYRQATSLISGIQKTFQDLCDFHNRMLEEKARFIEKDLPEIEHQLAARRKELHELLGEERRLNDLVVQRDTFENLEKLIDELNEKYRLKGEYENTLRQLDRVDTALAELNARLAEIDDGLFSEDAAQRIKEQIIKFNRHFSAVSYALYGEKYGLKVDRKTVKGRRLYEFSTFNLNFSSGKKQGEIVCFDIAYTLFADEEGIPCMHFLLNDKKELMHDNQLLLTAQLVNEKGIQFVASILRDKLPEELNREEYVIVRLSQREKLFGVE